MRCQIEAELDIKLDNTVHSNCNCCTLNYQNPDVSKYGRVRGCTISPKILCNYCGNCHSNPNEAVLVNPRPDDIEPRQTTSRCSPAASLSTTAFLKPVHWPDPWSRFNTPEVILLFVQIWGDIVAEERKERGNRKRFVTFVDDIEVHCVPVEPER